MKNKIFILLLILAPCLFAQQPSIETMTRQTGTFQTDTLSLKYGYRLGIIYVDSTVSTNINVMVSPDNTNFYKLSEDGAALTYTNITGENTGIPLKPSQHYPYSKVYLILSDSTLSSVKVGLMDYMRAR